MHTISIVLVLFTNLVIPLSTTHVVAPAEERLPLPQVRRAAGGAEFWVNREAGKVSVTNLTKSSIAVLLRGRDNPAEVVVALPLIEPGVTVTRYNLTITPTRLQAVVVVYDQTMCGFRAESQANKNGDFFDTLDPTHVLASYQTDVLLPKLGGR